MGYHRGPTPLPFPFTIHSPTRHCHEDRNRHRHGVRKGPDRETARKHPFRRAQGPHVPHRLPRAARDRPGRDRHRQGERGDRRDGARPRILAGLRDEHRRRRRPRLLAPRDGHRRRQRGRLPRRGLRPRQRVRPGPGAPDALSLRQAAPRPRAFAQERREPHRLRPHLQRRPLHLQARASGGHQVLLPEGAPDRFAQYTDFWDTIAHRAMDLLRVFLDTLPDSLDAISVPQD